MSIEIRLRARTSYGTRRLHIEPDEPGTVLRALMGRTTIEPQDVERLHALGLSVACHDCAVEVHAPTPPMPDPSVLRLPLRHAPVLGCTKADIFDHATAK